MIILKLLIILLFVYLSSKSLGIFIGKKTSLSYEISLGIGYMLNIAIFLICSFIPMYFRLSTNFLMISGTIYSIVCFSSIYFAIKEKKLFQFSKKELLALVIALAFTILFGIFVDFGYADMYDSYFYSILSNSASRVDKLSLINPYNGISDLQNYYKYISFYLESSYFANVLNITPAYLVLIWPFTFMAYYFMAITAFGIARISQKNYINNIVSVFILTMFTSFFRAPFNYLYTVNILLPIYMFYFAFRTFRETKFIWIYYIIFIAATACSSAVLYTSAALVLALFVSSFLKRDYDKLNTCFLIAIPTYMLGMLYMLEGKRTISSVIVAALILVFIWYVIRFKLIKRFARDVALFMLVLIPITFVVTPHDKALSNFSDAFVQQGVVDDKKATTTDNVCILDNKVVTENIDYKVDNNVFGTSMNYIYKEPHTLLNTSMILITHSIFMYGGLLFFLIYGFFVKSKEHVYKMFIIYILFFFNPCVSKGLSILTMNLNSRIYLFFNTFYAIYGIVWFFEWLEELNITFINKCIKYLYIPYAILLAISVYSYVSLLKAPDFNVYDPLYKVPKNIVESSEEISELVAKQDSEGRKPVVLYTIDSLALTMIDKNPNNKYKLIDSKDYKTYYFDTDVMTNKMLINLYFQTNGEYDFDYVEEHILDGNYEKKYCGINNLLKEYNVSYIVTSSKYRESYDKIKNEYDIVYDKNDILVFQRSS